ncbi:MAG: DEAD/DEAH box helicase family protein [Leptospiraceae bacterium]|nr:DEAD/DEAH box helicase family protein [Leptospiraceae bacterium]
MVDTSVRTSMSTGEKTSDTSESNVVHGDTGIGLESHVRSNGRVKKNEKKYKIQTAEDKESKKKELLSQEPTIINTEWIKDGLSDKDRREVTRKEFEKIKDRLPVTKDGKVIHFSMRGFKEMFHHSADKRGLSLIPQLPDLIEKGIYLWSELSEKNKNNVKAFHNYGVKVEINGKLEYVRLIIRENNNGNYFYDNDFIESDKIEEGSATPDDRDRKLSPLKKKLYQWWNFVNTNNIVPSELDLSESMIGNQNAKKDERSVPEKIADAAINAVGEVKQKWSQKKQAEINKKCKEILASTPPSRITDDQKSILRQYEGAGGQATNADMDATRGMLYQFFTPKKVISKMQEIVSRYVNPGAEALEPSAGIGRFAEGTNYKWDMLEYNPDDNTAYQIARILHPEANVSDNAFETMFIDKRNRSVGKKYAGKKYGLVVGNPPYGTMTGKYKAVEGKGFKRYEHYFISRGLDTLEEGGILSYVVPSSFLNSGEEAWKKEVFGKAELLEAYRLPEGSFGNTQIGTDVIVLRKNSSTDKDSKLAFSGRYFEENPEHVIGKEEKRINRFGREETFINGDVEDFSSLPLPAPKPPITQETKDAISEGLKGNQNAKKNTNPISVIFSGERSPALHIQENINKLSAESFDLKNKDKIQETINKFKQLLTEVSEKKSNMTVKGWIKNAEFYEKSAISAITRLEKKLSEFHQNPSEDLYTQKEFNEKFNKSFDSKDIEIVRNIDPTGIIRNLPFDKEKMALIENRDGEFDFVPLYAFQSGNIKDKLFALEKSKDSIVEKYGEEQYNRQKKALESAMPKKIDVSKLVLSPLEPFVQSMNFSDRQSLKDKFLEYVIGKPIYNNYGFGVKFSRYEGGLPREYFEGTDCRAMDIKAYMNGEKVTGRDAEENQRRRKERKIQAEKLFRQFVTEILSDDDQKELEEKWNDQFNSVTRLDSTRIPVSLAEMNKKYKGKAQDPRDIQMQYVGEFMTKGVGCATHEVGLGKTWTGMMANVSSLQTGKCKKPLIVVPTSVLQKWSLEFKERFPNVKSEMVGTPELNERLNSSDGKFQVEDGTVTIMSYDAFSRFGFTDERFRELTNDLKDQIINPDSEKGKRDTAKDKEGLESLTGLGIIGTEKNLKFDESGFDMITVDEAHNFNNIFVDIKTKDQFGGQDKLSKDEEEAVGKANEFGGITGGSPSARGIKLYLAAQHILKTNQDRNVLLLTATPFTNNPLQVYSLLSIVAKKKLRDMGIYNIRDFIATFVETSWENTIEGNGEIKQRQVVRNFKNGHAFQSLIREYFDFKQGDDNGVERPKLKMKAVILPLSEEQAKMRNRLEEMYDAKGADGKPSGAAPLVSIGVQQMMNISPALVKEGNSDVWKNFKGLNELGDSDFVERSPKIKFVANSIAELYKKHQDLKPGEPVPGQIIFMPKGVDYIQKVKQYLVNSGIPSEAIEIMDTKTKTSPAKDPAKKAKGLSRFTEITQDFNGINGKCKIILGTDVIKEGVSLNKYTGIAYNTSIDWNPTTEVQKRGRHHRPGNQLKNIMWVDTLMEDSIDSKLYQKQGEKISRINDIFKNTGSSAIDVSDINPDELKYEIIKDPERKAKLVLQEESGKIRAKAKEAQSKAFAVQEILDDIEEVEKDLDSKNEDLKDYLIEAENYQEYRKDYNKYIESDKDISWSWQRYSNDEILDEQKRNIDKTKKEMSALKVKLDIRMKQLERKSLSSIESAKKFVEKSQKQADKFHEESRELQTTKKDEYIAKFRKELAEKEAQRVKYSLDEIVTNHVNEVLDMLGVREMKKSWNSLNRSRITIYNFLKSKQVVNG